MQPSICSSGNAEPVCRWTFCNVAPILVAAVLQARLTDPSIPTLISLLGKCAMRAMVAAWRVLNRVVCLTSAVLAPHKALVSVVCLGYCCGLFPNTS